MNKPALLLLLLAGPAAAHLAIPFEVRGPSGARYSVSATYQDDPDPTLTKTRTGFLPASGSLVHTVFGYVAHGGFEVLRASFTHNSTVYNCTGVNVGIYEPLWHFKTTCRPTFTLNTVLNVCESACLVVADIQTSHAAGKAFPNPFRPGGPETHMHLQNLPASSRVRIFGPSGRLVFEGESGPAGGLNWNAHDRHGRQVGSGVYLVYAEGEGRKVKMKVAIER